MVQVDDLIRAFLDAPSAALNESAQLFKCRIPQPDHRGPLPRDVDDELSGRLATALQRISIRLRDALFLQKEV